MKYYNTGFSFSQHFCTQMYLNDTTNSADGTSLCSDSKLQLTALQEQPIKISQGGEYDSSTSMPSVPRVYYPAPWRLCFFVWEMLQLSQWMYMCAQLCLTLCDLMDSSLPGSFVHGIFHPRILEWVAISYPRGSSWRRDQICVSRTGRQIWILWAIWEGHPQRQGVLK